MLTVAISKRNKLQNIIVLTPKDGQNSVKKRRLFSKSLEKDTKQHATGQQNFKLSINNRGKL